VDFIINIPLLKFFDETKTKLRYSVDIIITCRLLVVNTQLWKIMEYFFFLIDTVRGDMSKKRMMCRLVGAREREKFLRLV